MPISVLLDHSDDLLQRLALLGEGRAPRRLFHQTELSLYVDQSPVWMPAGQALLSALQEAPEQWPGLLIHSPADERTLLDHLRRILVVRFDGGLRRGLLRYWSPRTASYFFSADVEEQARWMGPIERLGWHGGTWREKAEGREGWRSRDNPRFERWAAPQDSLPPCLSAEQEAALLQQQREHFVFQWLGTSGQPFAEAWEYFGEGLAVGFEESDPMSRYLDLRVAYRGQKAPAELSGNTTDERLAYLEEHLRQGSMNKEDHI